LALRTPVVKELTQALRKLEQIDFASSWKSRGGEMLSRRAKSGGCRLLPKSAAIIFTNSHGCILWRPLWRTNQILILR